MLNVWQRLLTEFLPSPPPFPDVKCREVSHRAPLTLPRSEPMNIWERVADWYPDETSCPNKLMWVMKGSVLGTRYGLLLLLMSEIKVWCCGKQILVQRSEIFTRMLSPGGNVKQKGGRENEPTDWLEGLCTFCVGRLPTLHACFLGASECLLQYD